jgi:hypothetical protein
MCMDLATSPLTARGLARFTHLSSMFEGMTHRVEELETLPYDRLVREAHSHIRPLGGGGATIMGQFVEVVRAAVGDRPPEELAEIAMNSMETLRTLASLRASQTKTAQRMLASDTTGDITLNDLPPSGTPWHPQWFRVDERRGLPRVVLSTTWDEAIDPGTGMTFRQVNRAALLDESRALSSEGCPAQMKLGARRGANAETAEVPSSFFRSFAVLARAAALTSIYDSTAPRPLDLRPGPSLVPTGAEGLQQIDAAIAAVRPGAELPAAGSLDRRPGSSRRRRTVKMVPTTTQPAEGPATGRTSTPSRPVVQGRDVGL